MIDKETAERQGAVLKWTFRSIIFGYPPTGVVERSAATGTGRLVVNVRLGGS